MSGPNTGLGNVNPQLAKDLQELQKTLQKAAPASAKRIKLAEASPDQLTPEIVYAWIDPPRVLAELEETSGKTARLLSYARNLLALAPLLLTWLALSWASGQYQQMVDAALKRDDLQTVNTPFLVLWERGFGTHTFFTFSHTAFLDFLLLAIIVVITFFAQTTDESAHRRAASLAKQVDEVIVPLIETVSRGRLRANANPQDWARVVQDTVKTAMNDVKTVMSTAQTVIQDVGTQTTQMIQTAGAQTTQMIRTEMRPLVVDLGKSVATLGQELQQYQQSVASIGKTVQDLSAAAGKVATASTSLSNTFGQYQQTADSIDRSIKGLSASQQTVAQASQQLSADLTKTAQSNAATARLVNDSAIKLGQAENSLNATATQLQKTSTDLSKASVRLQRAVNQAATPPPGGFWHWLFG